ncbi:MAG: chemotaxis protein CheW [Mariprofundaceae bacterium]
MVEEAFDVEHSAKGNAPIEKGEQVELMKVLMNGETFLLPVEDVAEILRPVEVTPVPMAPDHMLGVSNIRGQIVCIIDPGKVLHLKQKRGEQTESSRYLILRHPRMHLGIWVDEVFELYRVAKSSLPEINLEHYSHLRGEMNVEGNLFKLLNTQVLFD